MYEWNRLYKEYSAYRHDTLCIEQQPKMYLNRMQIFGILLSGIMVAISFGICVSRID